MLIILTTHPIQYQVPLWQALAAERHVPFEVWYLTNHAVKPTFDREFGKSFAWDLGRDSLEGYPRRFLNVKAGWNLHPSVFRGIRLDEDLRPLFKQIGATVLWIQGWQKLAYWQAAFQAKQVGMKVWLRGESNDLAPVKWWKWQVKRLWLGILFRKVDRFLCIGTANRRLYSKLGVPEGKLGSALYFVDNKRFEKQAAGLRSLRDTIRSEWKIPKDAFCVLFCGKFIPKKRPIDLVLAANLINTRKTLGEGRPVHLLFVGSGELGFSLRESVEVTFDADVPPSSPVDALRLETNSAAETSASFAGFLNQVDISRAYVAADCLVLPSDYGETWGLVVNEALASGVPCCASDACGSAEDLVAPLAKSAVFRLGDISALATAIERTSAGVEKSAIKNCIERFSIDVSLSSIKATYLRAQSSLK